jgi:hypothetical protein
MIEKFKSANNIIKKIIEEKNIKEKTLSRFYAVRLNRLEFFSNYDKEFLSHVMENKNSFKDKIIIEPGCGIGQNMIFLEENKISSIGVDPSNRVMVMHGYNDIFEGKIKILQKYFPSDAKEDADVVFVGNIMHTNTGKNFEKITDSLLEYGELFISKGNFAPEEARPYKVEWHDYFIKKCDEKKYILKEMKHLYYVKNTEAKNND